MSYDISLQIDTGGEEPATVWGGWNYTSNCVPMWCEAGADLADFDGKQAGQCAEILATAIVAMEEDMPRFRAMNPPNGWGDADRLVKRLYALLAAFRQHPLATVSVYR